MARVAIIDADSKTVENVIVAEPDFKPAPGKLAVATADGSIGDQWDGSKFIAPALSKDTLLYHAMTRNGDTATIAITIPATRTTPEIADVIVTPKDQENISRMADRAKKDPNFSAPWQVRHGSGVVLSAKQWIEFNEAITEWYLAHNRAYVGVVKAVHDGVITEDMEVDYPPKHLPQWPKRYIDTEKRTQQLNDIRAAVRASSAAAHHK